ncbi:hypothetical protein [Streptomyces yanii]|uniref:hypothetical protein n=1 Tax=Streptomyces yanii TaxID=78510 RepID=UPI0031F10F85
MSIEEKAQGYVEGRLQTRKWRRSGWRRTLHDRYRHQRMQMLMVRPGSGQGGGYPSHVKARIKEQTRAPIGHSSKVASSATSAIAVTATSARRLQPEPFLFSAQNLNDDIPFLGFTLCLVKNVPPNPFYQGLFFN